MLGQLGGMGGGAGGGAGGMPPGLAGMFGLGGGGGGGGGSIFLSREQVMARYHLMFAQIKQAEEQGMCAGEWAACSVWAESNCIPTSWHWFTDPDPNHHHHFTTTTLQAST